MVLVELTKLVHVPVIGTSHYFTRPTNTIFTLQIHHESLGADIERIFGWREEMPLHSRFPLSASGISTRSIVLPLGVASIGSIVFSFPAGGMGTVLIKAKPFSTWCPVEAFALDQALSSH